MSAVDSDGVLAGDGRRTVRVSTVTLDGPVAIGEWVLVHSGFALARLDAAEAATARRLRGDEAISTTKEPT